MGPVAAALVRWEAEPGGDARRPSVAVTSFIDPRLKVFGHMDRLAALKTGEAPPPINVECDLSNRCSLGCQWCHFAYTHVRGPLKGKQEKPAGAIPGGDLMDTELALRIVREFADAGVASITWTGGGEPTLHPDFDSIVEAAATTRLKQGLYTHGGHLNPDRAALLKAVMTFVYVSLDAADRESYKRDKGVDRFEAACDGVRRLSVAEGAATVGVGYLVTPDNWQHAERAIALVDELGGDYIQFRPTVRFDQATPEQLAEETGWLNDAIDHLERLQGDRVIVDLDRFRGYRDWRGHGYPTCWWSGLQTVVTPNGKVWTCVNKREHPAAEIGDLSRESFASLWARRPIARVDGSCRISCRGHVANSVLDEIMAPRPHPEFV